MFMYRLIVNSQPLLFSQHVFYMALLTISDLDCLHYRPLSCHEWRIKQTHNQERIHRFPKSIHTDRTGDNRRQLSHCRLRLPKYFNFRKMKLCISPHSLKLKYRIMSNYFSFISCSYLEFSQFSLKFTTRMMPVLSYVHFSNDANFFCHVHISNDFQISVKFTTCMMPVFFHLQFSNDASFLTQDAEIIFLADLSSNASIFWNVCLIGKEANGTSPRSVRFF